MFSGLKAGSLFYSFDKTNLNIDKGEVVSITSPMMQPSFTMNKPVMAVDIKVKFDSSEKDYKQVPSDKSIVDFGASGIVISDNMDSIIEFIKSFKADSEKAVNDYPRHKDIIVKCDDILVKFDPKTKKEVALEKDVALLKESIEEIKSLLKSLNTNQ